MWTSPTEWLRSILKAASSAVDGEGVWEGLGALAAAAAVAVGFAQYWGVGEERTRRAVRSELELAALVSDDPVLARDLRASAQKRLRRMLDSRSLRLDRDRAARYGVAVTALLLVSGAMLVITPEEDTFARVVWLVTFGTYVPIVPFAWWHFHRRNQRLNEPTPQT